jgi:hypothetical protein
MTVCWQTDHAETGFNTHPQVLEARVLVCLLCLIGVDVDRSDVSVMDWGVMLGEVVSKIVAAGIPEDVELALWRFASWLISIERIKTSCARTHHPFLPRVLGPDDGSR